MAKKNKTKYIFECMAIKELTEFNEEWNRKLNDYCDREDRFRPTLKCMFHSIDGQNPVAPYCRYLKIHTYKGDK